MGSDTKKETARKHTRVRATGAGFYNGSRIRKGMTFTLKADKDFSERWMVDADTTAPDEVADKRAQNARVLPGQPQRPANTLNGMAATAATRSADLTAPSTPGGDSKDVL